MNPRIKDDFTPEQPIIAVNSQWFNEVARRLNKLQGSAGIRVEGDKIRLGDDDYQFRTIISCEPSFNSAGELVALKFKAVRALCSLADAEVVVAVEPVETGGAT